MTNYSELECTTQADYDNAFRIALDVNRSDLSMVVEITNKRSFERTDGDREILEHCKTKYLPNGPCDSTYFIHASEKLQREYWEIHGQICDRLYR